MYKKWRQYDHMIRVVKEFHPDLLTDTHLHLAKVDDVFFPTDSLFTFFWRDLLPLENDETLDAVKLSPYLVSLRQTD